MNAGKNTIALLVHTCDRYAFLYPGFEAFFRRHWDFTIPCNLYFATEELPLNIEGFTNVRSGKGQWTNRLSHLLKHHITEDYVLYMQEDMWLSRNVNAGFFKQLFELAPANAWKQVKLHSSEVYSTNPTGQFIEGFNIAIVDNNRSGYLMSHQATLWNKAFLIEQLPANEHPWRNERKGTKRLKKKNPVIYHIDYFAENGKPEINPNQNPVGRSEYQAVSANGMLNDNVQPYIKKLQKGTEKEKQYALQLEHHYQNSLTHDGKKKPRKEDVFKKLKNWVAGKVNYP
jgi:hypothetical protein